MRHPIEMTAVTRINNCDVTVRGAIASGVRDAFAALAPKLPPNLNIRFVFESLDSVNSIGILEWRQAIAIIAQTHTLYFERCPVAFIDTCNMVDGMTGPAHARDAVVSFLAPYVCKKCSASFEAVLETKSLGMPLTAMPPSPCTLCRGPGMCEVAADDYLEFLIR